MSNLCQQDCLWSLFLPDHNLVFIQLHFLSQKLGGLLVPNTHLVLPVFSHGTRGFTLPSDIPFL